MATLAEKLSMYVSRPTDDGTCANRQLWKPEGFIHSLAIVLDYLYDGRPWL